MGKEAKGFDLVECHVKDATIGEEYANSFPLAFSPVKGVNLFVNCFQRSSPKIIYHPLYNEHVMKSRHELLCTINLTIRSQYSPFRRTWRGQTTFFHVVLGSGKTFKTFNF
jgi:hypothetical protein